MPHRPRRDAWPGSLRTAGRGLGGWGFFVGWWRLPARATLAWRAVAWTDHADLPLQRLDTGHEVRSRLWPHLPPCGVLERDRAALQDRRRTPDAHQAPLLQQRRLG